LISISHLNIWRCNNNLPTTVVTRTSCIRKRNNMSLSNPILSLTFRICQCEMKRSSVWQLHVEHTFVGPSTTMFVYGLFTPKMSNAEKLTSDKNIIAMNWVNLVWFVFRLQKSNTGHILKENKIWNLIERWPKENIFKNSGFKHPKNKLVKKITHDLYVTLLIFSPDFNSQSMFSSWNPVSFKCSIKPESIGQDLRLSKYGIIITCVWSTWL